MDLWLLWLHYGSMDLWIHVDTIHRYNLWLPHDPSVIVMDPDPSNVTTGKQSMDLLVDTTKSDRTIL